ncbi:MAG: FAD-binding oxidoreductase, partial [Anaerolineae bacterium]|nr:FAD-binding oxidoreductase [Anaerolineae bacterium]
MMSDQRIAEAANELGKRIEGEIQMDEAARILYSTDASIYQVKPLGIVYPKSTDDLQAAVEIADSFNIPLLPRGSGSSLAGQAVGEVLIIDCSRHLNKIINIDVQAMSAIVQPGVVLDNFNRSASKYGLRFGPDPASGERATFGGMIGNNSTGAHSITYGMTADNITKLDLVGSDGSMFSLEEISLQRAAQFGDKQGVEGRLYQTCLQIRSNYNDQIRSSWPQVWRKAAGYNLNYLLPWTATQPPQWSEGNYPPIKDGNINLAPIFVGSEGTLGVVKQAEIKLVRLPEKTILGVLSFNSIADACDETVRILELLPSAVELIPKALISRARAVPAYAQKLSFVKGDPEAVLVVEFSSSDVQQLKEKIKQLGENVVIAASPSQQNQIWGVRKVGLGLLMSIKGDIKPLP